MYTALERKKQGIAIKNLLLWDIKRFFPEEYEVGVNALKMVQMIRQRNINGIIQTLFQR